jgi:ribonuclease HII
MAASRQQTPLFAFYNMIEHEQNRIVAGVDEVGRGPLAGPVVTAAVILPAEHGIEGLNDSKKVSAKKREVLAEQIKQVALSYCVAQASIEEIDQLNILHATMLAMKRSVEGLQIKPDLVLVDGNRVPSINVECKAVVGGDGIEECISAASIVAKVARDHLMLQLAAQYPGYGLEKHMGYPTKFHLQALDEKGVTPIHRRSFAPVKKRL